MMKTPLLCLSAISCLSAFAEAQNLQAILFTGRFPFVSLDAPNNPGGAITSMTEFDFSYSIPLPGQPAVGRTLMPATAMQCYLGDGDQNGDYLKLRSWKPGYFTNIGIEGVFVKNGVASPTWSDVYWTPRLDAAAGPMEVLTSNGTPVVLAEGDWVRFLPNGNVEFFMTQAQMQIAVGAQSGAGTIGAGALVQAANGDLFYAPVDDGHWVNGNSNGSVFAQDGAICKIDAANISYDAAGNIASFAPNSARVLINETLGGPGGSLTVRLMVDNSGSYDRTGAPLVTAGVYGKTGGLGFDPNGGTWTPMYPDAAGNFLPEPNLVFCSNAGGYGGTIWSTNSNGQVAVINGALCGSTTAGVPADGSWLGVQLDVANFQPTLLAMTVIEIPQQPLVADMNDYGSLATSASQPTWDVDFFGAPGTPVFGLIAVGPQPPSVVVPSIDIGFIPLPWDAGSWRDVFLTSSPFGIGVGVTDGFGYTNISVPNPNTGSLTGITVMVQGLGVSPTAQFVMSSPVIVQLQ